MSEREALAGLSLQPRGEEPLAATALDERDRERHRCMNLGGKASALTPVLRGKGGRSASASSRRGGILAQPASYRAGKSAGEEAPILGMSAEGKTQATLEDQDT